jgi:opacity protein-like surface antigen
LNRKLLTAAALALSLAWVALGADAAMASGHNVTESATDGAVTARLSYVRSPTRFEDRFTKLSLTIERGGHTLFSGSLAPLVPANAVFRQGKSVSVQDLDGDGEPEVLVYGYTNGAHCCELAQTYRLAPGGTSYTETTRNFGDPGFRLSDLDHDGRPEFISGDDRFAYTFTAYAFSGCRARSGTTRRGASST